MPYITARDGQRLHVRVLGRGQPVLLLHGLGASGSQWLPFVWPLRQRAQFFLPDFRGHGRSLGVDLNQDDMFQNHMEDVEDVVRHFGLRDFLLGGHSMGATTSLHWLQAGGFDEVRGYLHIDQSPSVRNLEDWPHGLLGAQQGLQFDLMRRLVELLGQNLHYGRLDRLPEAARREVLELLAATQSLQGMPLMAGVVRLAARLPALLKLYPMQRISEIHRILATYLDSRDYRDALRACRVPVTVMVGMKSVLYSPEGQMAMATFTPQCDIVRFEKSGHLLPLNEPLKFAHELRRFVEAHAVAGSAAAATRQAIPE